MGFFNGHRVRLLLAPKPTPDCAIVIALHDGCRLSRVGPFPSPSDVWNSGRRGRRDEDAI